MLQKILSVAILFLCHYAAYSQTDYSEIYQTKISQSSTIEDSIIQVIVYRTSLTPSPKKIAVLTKTIGEKYPLWLTLEMAINERNIGEIYESLDGMSKKRLPTALETYRSNTKFVADLRTRRSSEIDESLDQKYKEESASILEYCYLIQQTASQGNTEKSYEVLQKLIYENRSKPYPGLLIAYFIEYGSFANKRKDEQHLNLLKNIIETTSRIELYFNTPYFYTEIGNIEKIRGNYIEALKNITQARDLSKAQKDTTRWISNQNNIAMFHQEQGRFEYAYEIIEDSKRLSIEANDTTAYLSSNNSIAFSKITEGKYEEAIASLKGSLIFTKNIPRSLETMTLYNLVDCYSSLSKLDSAFFYYNELKKADPNDRRQLRSPTESLIISYFIQENNIKKAQSIIEENLPFVEENNLLSEQSKLYEAQSQIYENQNMYEKALLFYKKHMAIEQDFRNEEHAVKVTEIQLNSDFENEKEVIALQNQKEKIQIAAQRNKALYAGLGTLLLAILGIASFIFVRRKNKIIAKQNKNLTKLNRLKDTMFQIIGHDLKKPSLSFRGLSENISYLIEKNDFVTLEKLGENVDQEAKALYNLTDNLLNWALIQKDTLTLTKTSFVLRDIVDENLDLFKNILDQKSIAIDLDIEQDLTISNDRNLVSTVIRNLLDNAIKFTSNGGDIILRVQKVSENIIINIIDSGVGMDKTLVDKIRSTDFVKSSEGTSGEKGSGIGLQLVKNLINKCGGQLEVISDIGQGSTFRVLLPQENL